MFSHVSGTQKMLCPRGEAWLARLEGKVTCKPGAAQQDGGGGGGCPAVTQAALQAAT